MARNGTAIARGAIACHVMAGTGAFAGGMGRAAANLSAALPALQVLDPVAP